MVILNEKEVKATISMFTKHKGSGLNYVILNRTAVPLDEWGKSPNPSVMGLTNEDRSIIVPMFNQDTDIIKMYLKQAKFAISVMSDVEFAFYYTRDRVVTWRGHKVSEPYYSNRMKSDTKAVWENKAIEN